MLRRERAGSWRAVIRAGMMEATTTITKAFTPCQAISVQSITTGMFAVPWKATGNGSKPMPARNI